MLIRVTRLIRPRTSTRLSNWLLTSFQESEVGVVIFSRRLRFVGVNEIVASWHRVALEEHVGRRVADFVPSISRTIEARVEQDFRTGQPLNQFELSKRLPTRKNVGHWLDDFIPVTDHRGRVREVAVIAREITAQKQLRDLMRDYGRDLPRLRNRISVPIPPQELAPSVLTPRELQVARLLAYGKSNKQVAAELDISEKTVETYRVRLMRKLGLGSVVEIARYAIRHGLVEL